MQSNDHISFSRWAISQPDFREWEEPRSPIFSGDFLDEKLMSSWEFDKMIFENYQEISGATGLITTRVWPLKTYWNTYWLSRKSGSLTLRHW